MEEYADRSPKKIITLFIVLISIIIPVVVAILFFKPESNTNGLGWIYILPHMNAVINGMTTLILLMGYIFINTKNVRMHRTCMTTAFFLGLLFLVSYLIFHYSAPATIFGDINRDGLLGVDEAERVGGQRNIYLAILLSHALLAVIVVPFIFFSFYFALNNKFERHKQIVKFTLPVWLYVSISGLVVYWLVRPYYPV